jgi:hypothetical protein
MNRSFSLTTLLLLVTLSAIGLASVRTAIARTWHAPNGATVGLMVAAGIGGALFGLVLSAWNRNGWPADVGSMVGGFYLGVTAGAQLTNPVDWQLLCAVPIVLISTAMLVAATRRRPPQSTDSEQPPGL